MKKCKKCEKYHEEKHPHFKTVSKLTDKGFPVHTKGYKAAHEAANKAEKKAYGKKAFDAVEKIAKNEGKHELIGKNSRSGKLEVAKKVPTKYRSEIAFHEEKENKILRRKK